jgi:hypothetical protein
MRKIESDRQALHRFNRHQVEDVISHPLKPIFDSCDACWLRCSEVQSFSFRLRSSSPSIRGNFNEPPSGSGCGLSPWGNVGTDFGAELIATYRPDYWLCGHAHFAPALPQGRWWDRLDSTWIFNPGQGEFTVNAISLDTEALAAAWISEGRREEIDLRALLAR